MPTHCAAPADRSAADADRSTATAPGPVAPVASPTATTSPTPAAPATAGAASAPASVTAPAPAGADAKKKRAFQARAIGPSTINNPTAGDYAACRTAVANGVLKYVTFNLEVGVTGTPHLQIHAIAPTALTTTAWQKALGGRVGHITRTKSPPDCVDYCQGFTVGTERSVRKTGSQLVTATDPGFEVFGTASRQGSRSDLLLAVDQLKDGSTVRDLIETMPGTVAGAYRMLTDYHRETRLLTAREQVLANYDDVEWTPFQQYVLDLIDTSADGRTLHWFHEPDGNVGKSHLATFLSCNRLAYCPDVTKAADIFCGYDLEPVVIFDIPRSRIDTMDHIYGVIEKFLDGCIFVGKYFSHGMVIPKPHVIVFSNDPPKLENAAGHKTLSEDRWHIGDVRNFPFPAMPPRKRHKPCGAGCTNANCSCKSKPVRVDAAPPVTVASR